MHHTPISVYHRFLYVVLQSQYPYPLQTLKGEGMPRRKLGGRGDLIVRFDITFPKAPLKPESLVAAGITP